MKRVRTTSTYVNRPFKRPRYTSSVTRTDGMVLYKTPIMGINTRGFGNGGTNATEIKALDVPSETYPVTATPTIVLLNGVRTGSSFYNRIGRKIDLKSVRVSGIMTPTGRETQTPEYARVMILYDRQTNGVFPSVQDVLQTTDSAGANTTTAYSGLNLNNRDRFIMLRDERIYLPSINNVDSDEAGPAKLATGIQDQVTPALNLDYYVKLRGLTTQYKADTGASVGDVATGGLYLVLIGSVALGAQGWNFQAESRLRFLDP